MNGGLLIFDLLALYLIISEYQQRASSETTKEFTRRALLDLFSFSGAASTRIDSLDPGWITFPE